MDAAAPAPPPDANGGAPGPSTSAPAPQTAANGGTLLPPGASGVSPTLQNMVATVNLGTRLDLKAIALHARNAEYNPKVNGVGEWCACAGGVGGRGGRGAFCEARRGGILVPDPPLPPLPSLPALCRRHHAHPGPQDDRPHLRVGQDGA